MAKTFYKYQERDLDNRVNYADIGIRMADMITDQIATRKAKKEAYDDQMTAFGQYLAESPEGDDKNMTEWTADYASQMQAMMLANQRAFKSGNKSERDHIVFMQNIQNGTKTMFDLSKEYQDEYKIKMKRMLSNDPKDKSQVLEQFFMNDAGGYFNYKDTKPIIDPETGLILVSRKNKDGKFETVPAQYLRTRIKTQVDYFDADAATTAIENGIGEEITSELVKASRSAGGSITQVQDKEIKAGFQAALTAQLKSYLATETNISSILTNSLKDEKYTFTYNRDEAEADPTKILLTIEPGGDGTPVPDFSTTHGKAQEQKALDFLYKQTIQKIDRKVEQTYIGKEQDVQRFAPQGRSAYSYANEERRNAAKNFAENMYTFLYSSNPGEIQTAANYLAAQGGENFSGGIGKNQYGTYTSSGDNPGTDGEKQARALVGILDQEKAYAEIIMQEFEKQGGGGTISKGAGQSGKTPKKQKKTNTAVYNK